MATPKIQRFEKLRTNNYAYAPEWKINQEDRYEDYDPLKKNITTPEKWEYYNKVKFYIDILNI